MICKCVFKSVLSKKKSTNEKRVINRSQSKVIEAAKFIDDTFIIHEFSNGIDMLNIELISKQSVSSV